MACISDRNILSNLINACSMREGVISQLIAVCEDIEALANPNVQRNRSIGQVDFVAGTATEFNISDTVTVDNPAGSLVGNQITIQNTGFHRYNLNIELPTSGVAEIFTFEVLINGIAYDTLFLEDDGVNGVSYSNTLYGNFTAADILSFQGTSLTGLLGGALLVDFEFLI